jgi:hypothetical protein
VDWINIFGLIIVVLLLLPNMIYYSKNKSVDNKCKNKAMNFFEQVGRYGSMFLMVFNIGILEFGFRSKTVFNMWLICIILLISIYWGVWFLYFKKIRILYSMILAIIPSVIFVSQGIILRHWLLLIFGIIFSVSHIYVTYQNS